jgi:GNAT superfamily N-acetyltransferase
MSVHAAPLAAPDLPPLDPAAVAPRDGGGVTLEALDLRSRRDRRRFLDVAPPIYRGDPCWVAPLRMERMRFLDPARSPTLTTLEIHALVARRAGRDVGRITAHVDREFDRLHHARAGWFGFLETIDDAAVAGALLAAAARWLRDRGARTMVGPTNFTTNHTCGLLVENFTRPPMLETTYNPPYYERHLTSAGLAKVTDLYAWWLDLDDADVRAKLARVAALAARVRTREGLTVRHGDRRRFAEECALIFDLYNRAWRANWGFVPIRRAEALHVAESVRPIVREELVLVAETRGRPVAFALTLPDLNEVLPRSGRLLPFGWVGLALARRRIRHARVALLGVVPEYRRRGIEAVLIAETALRCRAAGLRSGEMSWTLESNVLVNRAIESAGGRRDRVYRVFGATLAGEPRG